MLCLTVWAYLPGNRLSCCAGAGHVLAFMAGGALLGGTQLGSSIA